MPYQFLRNRPQKCKFSTVAILASLVAFYILVVDSYFRPRTNAVLLDEKYASLTLNDAHSDNDDATSQKSTYTRILLVSAMFPLAHSKHSKEDYALWLQRFLGSITTDIYFYTTPDLESTVREVRGSLPIVINTSFSSPFDIPPLKGLEKTYEDMHNKDREKKIHNPELYAIWNGKPYLLNEATRELENHGQRYDYVFWNDAGSFRGDHKYRNWPDPARVDRIWEEGSHLTGIDRRDLFFIPINDVPRTSMRYWREDMGPIDNEVSEGSFFGGSPQTVDWWARTFYAYHNYYLSLGLFVGKDQTVINAISLLFPERIITVWHGDPLAPAHSGLVPYFDQGSLGACGSEWFYYQFWLADGKTRNEMRELWMGQTRWEWEWWKERQVCRLTGLLGIRQLWTRRFGMSWRPPARTVVIPL